MRNIYSKVLFCLILSCFCVNVTLYLSYKNKFLVFPSLLCSGTTWVLMNLSNSQLWYLSSPLFFPTLLRSGEVLLQLFLFSDRSVLYLVLSFKHFSLFPCLQFLPYENCSSYNSNYIFMVNCTLSLISLAFFFPCHF